MPSDNSHDYAMPARLVIVKRKRPPKPISTFWSLRMVTATSAQLPRPRKKHPHHQCAPGADSRAAAATSAHRVTVYTRTGPSVVVVAGPAGDVPCVPVEHLSVLDQPVTGNSERELIVRRARILWVGHLDHPPSIPNELLCLVGGVSIAFPAHTDQSHQLALNVGNLAYKA
ncbi:hypothetical protein AB5J72_05985 [Streptomyces sp. CG1]|uniref:hypothetical protein n=1 Tax=Streptomyces sp. CG1 TaxID=1287523 RepID=UPI0034E2128E